MTHGDRLAELADHYDNTDLADHIDQATWEDPGPVVEPMVTYALRLPKPIIDALRAAAASRGVKVSTLMREWLEERLGQAQTDPDAAIPVSAILALVAERATPAEHTTL